MSEKVTAMIEEIKGLTVLELSELVHALEEEFGVSAAAMAAPAAGAAAPAAEEKTDFDVVLTGFDAAAKIKVIKVVREITGQGLAEAKATVEGAPSTMKEAVSKARITVRNVGETIPAEELPLLFERFHKSDKSRSEDKDGYGLGLYIVKTILQQHKEEINVTSENGVTTFTFSLRVE